jgi:hypothetical protein
MQLQTHDTVSTKAQAVILFGDETAGADRRRRRSSDPEKAVNFQFDRVLDVVASEAIVLCDQRGRSLTGRGHQQLCRMLAHTVPSIVAGDRRQVDYKLKALDILRPGADISNVSLRPIVMPSGRRHLFVASLSESTFNEVGVHHASGGVRRILGIPHPYSRVAPMPSLVSSRDRLNYDVVRAISHGFQAFNETALAAQLRIPRRSSRVPGRDYVRALTVMLGPVDRRLAREGLTVQRPGLRSRWLNWGETRNDGYRIRRFKLPLRELRSGRRLGLLTLEMLTYDRAFAIPRPPRVALRID